MLDSIEDRQYPSICFSFSGQVAPKRSLFGRIMGPGPKSDCLSGVYSSTFQASACTGALFARFSFTNVVDSFSLVADEVKSGEVL